MKDLIGHSPAIQKVRKQIKHLSKNRKNVVISGEHGVGKQLVAESIHLRSSDARKPYAILNVSTIDELKLQGIVQSLLTKREFANPVTSEHGNFQLPRGAAIILDGIERASLASQQILNELFIAGKREKLDIRFMVLLERDVKEGVKAGNLSSALGKEVKAWEHIRVASLRERPEDIPELVEHFVAEAGRQQGIGGVVIDINAVGVLVRKEWSGNVQELKSFVEQTMMSAVDKSLFRLPEVMIDEHSELNRMLEKIEGGVEFAIDNSMEIIEKRILERVLLKFGFNQSRTARFLRIREDTLRYRMRKLGIRTSHET